MHKAVVIAKLREHEPELKAAGIARLFLFGSVARGERGNDVDLWPSLTNPDASLYSTRPVWK